MSVDQQFNSINDKLQQLLRNYSRLQKDYDRLNAELRAAREKEQLHQEQLDSLQQQIAILKAATGSLSEKDKKEFEKKIGQYIREIDKCISYLSE